MVNSRLRKIVEADTPTPQTCTQSKRQRIPPSLKTATGADTPDSTVVELYFQQRKLHDARNPLRYTILCIRPATQEIPRFKNAQRSYSERLDGISVEKVRSRLLHKLESIYIEENPLGGAWEYLYSYMSRTDVRAQLESQVEEIKHSLEN